MIPEAFLSGYSAARKRAATVERLDRGLIVVSGRDRASYLHGLLTNDITALRAGQGCYAAYLTPQGRMITDLWLYELDDVLLVSLGAARKDAFLAKLDQFIFSEDVQLGDVTATFASLVVLGPDAARVASSALADVSVEALSTLGEHGNLRAVFGGGAAIVLRVTDLGEPGYEVLVEQAHRDAFALALGNAGAVLIGPDVVEVLRIEGGVPKFGVDMDEETIPLEAGIEDRAISLTKGCYVGQEVIIRILHRGHGRVARKLVGLVLEGESVPAAGASVQADGKDIGDVRSAVMSPALKQPIALAYLQRDFLTPGTQVSVNGAVGTVTALPFVDRA